MSLDITYLLISIVGLYFGAELSLESGEKIGKYFGLSPLVIGLLIIGFGTSLPEFFVSQLACYRGVSSLAMGNIIGSNIANFFLIIGVSLFLVKINLSSAQIKRQINIHFILIAIMFGILLLPKLYIFSGVALGGFFIFYMLEVFREYEEEGEAATGHNPVDKLKKLDIVKLLFGFTLLYGAGELLVFSGQNIGLALGVSPYVISAIFVAFGTSFPELVTSLLACFKKKDVELITGNIIGSNTFNIAFVLASLTGYKITIDRSYLIELVSLLVGMIVFFIYAKFNKKLGKIEGVLFLGVYGLNVFFWLS